MQQYIGMSLGVYQIVEQIGQGGMATVFKAYQPSMDRYVAVKIMPVHFTEDETFVARFTQEAHILARLEHPNILPVHDYGEQEGITYLVMRYIKAGTLKDLIAREGALDLKEAARILSQVGGGLDYAHSQGVIHRDVKPTNVLIEQRGDTFLTDFGISKLVAETAQFTASGGIVGTPAYMSPEQSMSERLDHRCDIYSLGITLYEMVTGRVPYSAETPLAVLLKHVKAPLPLARQIRPDLPEAMELVILKAMAKSPDDRFQTATEMVDALQKATVADMPTEIAMPKPTAEEAEVTALPQSISVSPPPASAGTPPRLVVAAPSRKSLPWLPIAGAGILLVILLVVALFSLPKPIGNQTTTTESPPAAVLPGETTETGSPTTAVLPGETTKAGSLPTEVLPVAAPDQITSPSGWTNYGNSNFVSVLARQDDYLWAGGESGLVRWDLTNGSYIKFGVAEGLASSSVNDLLVNQGGVLWVATDAGINRFDGQTWITFNETDGLDTNLIQDLFLDDDGGLWAAGAYGESGLNYYDGTSWAAPPIPPLPVEYPSVRVVTGYEEEGLLVGLESEGLAVFNGEVWTLLTSDDGLPSDEILDVLWTEDALWVSTVLGVVQYDPQMGDLKIIPQLENVAIYAMHQTSHNRELWFVGERGATRFNPDTGDWTEFQAAPGPLPISLVTDIVEDENGLWFSTYGGGVVFNDGSRWDTWTTADELGGNVIEAIWEDTDGVLWFLHPGTGLSSYNPERDEWQSFEKTGGALDWPSYPAVDSDGNLWIGGYGELVRYDGNGWQKFASPDLMDVTIYAIDIGPGDIKWLATDRGFMRHNPTTDEWTTFTRADHQVLEDIWAFLVSGDGTVWVGGEEALIQYDGTNWKIPEALGNAPINVTEIAEAPDGSLWVAADGEIYHLDDGRWDRFGWPADGWVERLAVGPDGSVWAGYEGLGRFDPTSGGWQVFTPAEGLMHLIVRAIHVTPEGVVWVGTDGGLSRYDPPD